MKCGIGFVILLVILASPVSAVLVNHEAPGGIAAVILEGGDMSTGSGPSPYVLCADGSVKWFGNAQTWVEVMHPLPIPLDDVVHWTFNTFTTYDGSVWIWVNSQGDWVNIGQPCAGVVEQSDNSSMGSTKQLFR